MMPTPHRALRPALPVALVAVLFLAGAATAPLQAAEEPVAEDTPRLGEIVIEGNTRTSETLIRRELGLVPGQPFTYDDMDAIWDHLEDLGYFAFVDMEYDDLDPEHVVLRVVVEEDTTLHYGPLVRYDRRHKYLLGARFEERNLRGAGENLKGGISVYYIQRGELAWTRPWLFGARGLQATIAADAEQANFVFRPTDYRKWNAGLELRWDIAGPLYVRGSATYGWFKQRDDYTWPLPDRGAGPGVPANYSAGTASHWVFRGTLGVDTRDNPYYPLRGVMLEGGAGRWTSDDFPSYTETLGDARVFIPMPYAKHVLAARAWGRDTDGPAQLDNVLYFGGPQTVRGYRFGGREGDQGYLLSVEYRAPLFIMPISPRGEMIGAGLHGFFDAGDTWYDGADAGRSMRSWGAGVHLNLDTWQLRFEAANTDEGDWVFEFMDKFNF